MKTQASIIRDRIQKLIYDDDCLAWIVDRAMDTDDLSTIVFGKPHLNVDVCLYCKKDPETCDVECGEAIKNWLKEKSE
jgi:hypothetical protein